MSTLSTTNLKNPDAVESNIVMNADGTIGGACLTQTCRAWVNFNGTGTVAIRASYNVSSITDGGVGIYTVNFTNALADTSYSTICGISKTDAASNSGSGNIYEGGTYSTSAVQVFIEIANGTNIDPATFCVAVFR